MKKNRFEFYSNFHLADGPGVDFASKANWYQKN